MKKTLLVSFFFLLLLPIFGGHYSSLSAQGLPDQEIDEVVVEAEYKIECPHCGAKLNDIEYATHECKPDLSDSEPEYRCSICNRPYSECDCTGAEVVANYDESSSWHSGFSGSINPPTPTIPPATNNNKNKNGKYIVIDCSSVTLNSAKKAVKTAFDLLQNTKDTVINGNKYIGFEEYCQTVRNDTANNEYSTSLRDYGKNGSMLDKTEKGTKTLSTFSYSQSSIAILHNHPNQTVMSPLDIMSLIEANQNSAIKSTFIWDSKNDIYYCATISDSTKAKAFWEKYKSEVDMETHNWKEDGEINIYLESKNKEFKNIITNEQGKITEMFQMSAILNHFDSGINIVSIHRGSKTSDQIYSGYDTKTETSYDKKNKPVETLTLVFCQ